MPQLISRYGEVECPVCDSLLSTVLEQSKRIHVMLHPSASCVWSERKYLVDRWTGYAEEVRGEVHPAPEPA